MFKVNDIFFARLISFVLGPQLLLPFLLVVIFLRAGLSSSQLVVLVPTLIFTQMVIPLGFIYWAFKKGKISDLDLSVRKERIIPLLVATLSMAFSLMIIFYFGNRFLLDLFIILALLLLVNGFITLFWKISFHVGLNSVFSVLVNFLLNWSLPFVYFFIPLVSWARLRLKKHTPSQVVAGFIFNTGLTLFLLYFFGFLS